MKRVITSMSYGTCHHTCYRIFPLSLTWIVDNATRYHNFNALIHALLYIFSQFKMVCDYLQPVTTRYHQIYKTIYINDLLKKNKGNTW